MDSLSYIAIVVTCVSAILAALLNTEIDRDQPRRRRQVFRQPTLVGWLLIVLTIISSAVAAGIEKSNQNSKEQTKARLGQIQASLNDEKKVADLESRKVDETNLALSTATAKLDLQSQFSKNQASLASDRARQQSDDLAQAREQLATEQRRAASEIEQQEQVNQTATSAQQELIEASLLGQQTASPRVALILPTAYVPSMEEKERWSIAFEDGAHVVPLVLGEQLANVRSSPVAELDAEFASLEPRIADPIHDTVEYGWRTELAVTRNLKSQVIASFGGPHDLIGRKPRFQLGYDAKENRVYLQLEASLRKPVSSALLFLGSPPGQQVASFSINVQDLDESTIHTAEEHIRDLFTEGEEWTLISDPSAMCAIAKIARPTIQDDGPARQDHRPGKIEIRWHIDQTNRLAICPKGLFFTDETEESLDKFDPDEQ